VVRIVGQGIRVKLDGGKVLAAGRSRTGCAGSHRPCHSLKPGMRPGKWLLRAGVQGGKSPLSRFSDRLRQNAKSYGAWVGVCAGTPFEVFWIHEHGRKAIDFVAGGRQQTGSLTSKIRQRDNLERKPPHHLRPPLRAHNTSANPRRPRMIG
jgi:hypothetical protein